MPQVTLADLDLRVLSRIDGNTRLYPTARRYAAINEALKVIGAFTNLYQQSYTLTSQPNRIWYDVPAGLVFPTRVQFENTYLEKTSLLQLGRASNKWVTDTSANQLTPPVSWLPYGFKKFAIHPADSRGGAIITVTGPAEPTLLVNPTDNASIENSYYAAFDEYAVLTLILKESPKTFAQASTNYQAFIKVMKDIGAYRSFIAPRYWVEAEQPSRRG